MTLTWKLDQFRPHATIRDVELYRIVCKEKNIASQEEFVEMGLEVGSLAGLRRERGSTLLVFCPCQLRPQTLYLPQCYEATLRFLYEATACKHNFLLSIASLPLEIKTQATLQNVNDTSVAQLTFTVIGDDFEDRLATLESEASGTGAVVTQVFLPLTEPWIGKAIDILRRRGYFIGGALPSLFGDDGLFMQKVRLLPYFDQIVVCSKRGHQLKELVWEDIESVRAFTVGEALAKIARLLPENIALRYPQRSRNYSYAELDNTAEKVAKALITLGIQRGEHAAIWAPNIPEYLPVVFGCSRVGVPLVLINTNYRAYELEYVLKQSDTTTLFLADGATRRGEYLEALEKVHSHLPKLRHVIVLGHDGPTGMFTWQEFLYLSRRANDTQLSARSQEITENDIFAIQYTSGTTGAPKGVMFSHLAYLLSADIYCDRQGLNLNDVLCIPLPFFHVYGSVVSLSALLIGATVAVLEQFRAPDLLQIMENYRVTTVSGTPTMFIAALAEISNRSYDLSSLRGGNMGGSFCPPELVQAVIERMGAPGFSVLYGSTEGLCSLLSAPSATLEQRTKTVGNAMTFYEMKIIDCQTRACVVAEGATGELCIRSSPVMMTRYYNMEEATARAIDGEGWLHSGDLARVDAAGFYQITGRIKDMIIRGGENIYPAEIETFLLTHPKVLDVQVVGIPCKYFGEEIIAFLRLKQGQSANVLEMKRYCRERIAIIKVPAMFFFVDNYPLTASGKVQKFKLQELAVEKLIES